MPSATRNTMAAIAMYLALATLHGGQAAEDPDSIQILSTTKSYLDATSTVSDYKLTIFKQTQGWAMVSVIPALEGNHEGAGVILEKVNNKWIVRDMGTDLSDYDPNFE